MTDYDLVVVGAGSGNMLPTAAVDRMRVAIVEHRFEAFRAETLALWG